MSETTFSLHNNNVIGMNLMNLTNFYILFTTASNPVSSPTFYACLQRYKLYCVAVAHIRYYTSVYCKMWKSSGGG